MKYSFCSLRDVPVPKTAADGDNKNANKLGKLAINYGPLFSRGPASTYYRKNAVHKSPDGTTAARRMALQG
jgi:hypothetical protein